MYDQTMITGNLGRDPEPKYTAEGKLVVTFSVAVRRPNKATLWYRVTAWEKTGEIANEYLKKGHKVLCIGVLDFDADTGGPRVYQKNDGSYGASFELTAHRVILLESKDSAHATAQAAKPQAPTGKPEEDEMPF